MRKILPALWIAVAIGFAPGLQAADSSNVSGAGRIQGTGDAGRGDPVNVRLTTCSAGTCTAVTAPSGDAGAVQADPGSDATKATAVQGVTNGKPVPVAGAVASGVAEVNTVGIGGRAQNTVPTAVTLGQHVNAWLGTVGNQVVGGLNQAATDGTNATITYIPDTGGTARPLGVAGYYYNGTTFDLVRGGTGGANVQGGVASATTDSGNPVKIGGIGLSTAAASVTTGQRVNAWYTVKGSANIAITDASGNQTDLLLANTDTVGTGSTYRVPVTSIGLVWDGTSTFPRQRGDTAGTVAQPYAMTGSRWQYAAASGGISNTTTAVTIAAAAGASVRNYVTSAQICSDTLGSATEVAIRDGAAGTVIWRTKLQTTSLPCQNYQFPVALKGTANTLMEVVTLTATVTGGVFFNAQGYTAP